jgi:hypothetical protein
MSWTPVVRKANSFRWRLFGQIARMPVGISPYVYTCQCYLANLRGMSTYKRAKDEGNSAPRIVRAKSPLDFNVSHCYWSREARLNTANDTESRKQTAPCWNKVSIGNGEILCFQPNAEIARVLAARSIELFRIRYVVNFWTRILKPYHITKCECIPSYVVH